MKLVFKITFLFLLISSVVFLVGGMFIYNAMSREIEKEEKFFLEERLQSVVNLLERRSPSRKMVRDKVVIEPLDSLTAETPIVFSDTLVTHTTLQRLENHMKLDVIKKVNGKAYKIMLYDLIIEEDDIEDAVRESMTKTYLLLMAVLLILSFVTSYFVFKPFQATLAAIRDFSVRQSGVVKLPGSSTSEFNKLNLFVEKMTAKAIRDYQSLKEFSENASHEIQTPLSIAQGKLELLMESANMNEEQMELITSAQQALRRLSKMGNSLSLLTKIENKEFSDFATVDMTNVVSALLFDFKELIELKSIQQETHIASNVLVKGNQVLLEIMVTNLLNNAIRHNHTNGQLSVTLDSEKLKVTNSGSEMKDQLSNYFLRFKKGSDNPDSTGLGLSIVKKVCDEHGFEVKYEVFSKQHELTVSWTRVN